MSEIVYTQKTSTNVDVKSMVQGRAPVEEKFTIFQHDNKVALVRSLLIVGVAQPYSDKRYYYWRTVGSLGFIRNKGGNIVAYHCEREYDAKPGTPWAFRAPIQPFMMLDDDLPRFKTEAKGEFKFAVKQSLGVESLYDIYPLTDEYGIDHFNAIPPSLTRGFRLNHLESLTAYAFGKSRLNRRLVQAVSKTDPWIVSYAQQFRGLVDDDKVVSLIENNNVDEEKMSGVLGNNLNNLRPVFKACDKKYLEELVNLEINASPTSTRLLAFQTFPKQPTRADANAYVRTVVQHLADTRQSVVV